MRHEKKKHGGDGRSAVHLKRIEIWSGMRRGLSHRFNTDFAFRHCGDYVLRMFGKILAFILLLLSASVLYAQSSVPEDSLKRMDTVQVDQTVVDSGFVMKKSPLGAVLRSAIVPGLGQLYNESYWKIPIVVGVTAFIVRGYIVEHNDYANYRDQYAASITTENKNGDLLLKRYREYYRNRRDTYAWYGLVFHLLQIADAFVDAHLYDFDVSDEMTVSLGPTQNGMLGLQLRW